MRLVSLDTRITENTWSVRMSNRMTQGSQIQRYGCLWAFMEQIIQRYESYLLHRETWKTDNTKVKKSHINNARRWLLQWWATRRSAERYSKLQSTTKDGCELYTWPTGSGYSSPRRRPPKQSKMGKERRSQDLETAKQWDGTNVWILHTLLQEWAHRTALQRMKLPEEILQGSQLR